MGANNLDAYSLFIFQKILNPKALINQRFFWILNVYNIENFRFATLPS